MTVIVGAPVSFSVVPAAGVCFATLSTAYPCTLPTTFQARPLSSSVPFANTNAWPLTSGTTTVATGTGAGAPLGTAEIRFAAPTASVALASKSTMPTTARRGKRVAIRRAMFPQSAGNGLNSTPCAGEGDYPVTRFRDDREDPGGLWDAGRLEGRRGVLPAESPARKALEPRLPLRPGRRRL